MVNELISHTRHLFPWNFRIFTSERFRNVFCCLANYFNSPYYSIIGFSLFYEIRKGVVFYKLFNSINRIKNIPYKIFSFSFFHTYCTSSRICFPIFGFRVVFITKSTFLPRSLLNCSSKPTNSRIPQGFSNSTRISTSLFFFRFHPYDPFISIKCLH